MYISGFIFFNPNSFLNNFEEENSIFHNVVCDIYTYQTVNLFEKHNGERFLKEGKNKVELATLLLCCLARGGVSWGCCMSRRESQLKVPGERDRKQKNLLRREAISSKDPQRVGWFKVPILWGK